MTPEVARQVREREQVIAERAREAATQAMGEGAEGLDAAKLARVARLMGHDASARIVATLKPSEIDWLLAYTEAHVGGAEARLGGMHGKVAKRWRPGDRPRPERGGDPRAPLRCGSPRAWGPRRREEAQPGLEPGGALRPPEERLTRSSPQA